MEKNQTYNLSADFLGGYSSMFMNLVYVLIGVYLLVIVLNILRDKYINQVTDSKKDNIGDLLAILSSLFILSGFGFIIGNIIQVLFSHMSRSNSMPAMNFRNEWDYLTFGFILIFAGYGFKGARNALKSDQVE